MGLFKELVTSSKSLTDQLLDEVSDIDIYCELTGIDIDVGKPISSPIRENDDTPSFSLFIPTRIRNPRPEEIWWRDFAGDSGNVFKFVQHYAAYQYSIALNTRRDIIEFLDSELQLGIFVNSIKVERSKRTLDYESIKESKEILFQSRSFTKLDLFWWIKYGIDENMLNFYDVRSVKYLLNDDYTVRHSFGTYELAFAYVVYDKVKIYCPHSVNYKWRNTCPVEYILGEAQQTNSTTLIITKSLKDIMVFKSFINCDIIAPQAEGTFFSKEVIAKIKEQYEDIYVVMDYDPAGRKAANYLKKEGFTIKWVSKKEILINNKLKIKDKDISDYVNHNGIVNGFKRMQKMFPKIDDSLFKHKEVTRLSLLKNELLN